MIDRIWLCRIATACLCILYLCTAVAPADAAPMANAQQRRLFAPLRKGHVPDRHSANLGRFREQHIVDVPSLFRAIADASAESSGMVRKESEFGAHLAFATDQARRLWTALRTGDPHGQYMRRQSWKPEEINAAVDLAARLWAESRKITRGPRLMFSAASKKDLRRCIGESRHSLYRALDQLSEDWAAPNTTLANKAERYSFLKGLKVFSAIGLDPWKSKNLEHDSTLLDKYTLRAVEMNRKAWGQTKTLTERGEVFLETVVLLKTLRSIDARYVDLLQQHADKEMQKLLNDGITEADAFFRENKDMGYKKSEAALRRLLPVLAPLCLSPPSSVRGLLSNFMETNLTAISTVDAAPERDEVLSLYRLVTDMQQRLSPVKESIPPAIKRTLGEVERQATQRIRAEHPIAVAEVDWATRKFQTIRPPTIVRDLGEGTYGNHFKPWLIDGQRGDGRAVLEAVAPHLARLDRIKATIGRAKRLSSVVKELGIDVATAEAELERAQKTLANFEPIFPLVALDGTTARMEQEVILCHRLKDYRKKNTRFWANGQCAYVSAEAYHAISNLFSRETFTTAAQMRSRIAEAVGSPSHERVLFNALNELEGHLRPMTFDVSSVARSTPRLDIPADARGLAHAIARILVAADGRPLSREEIARRLPKDSRPLAHLDTLGLIVDLEMPKVQKIVKSMAKAQRPGASFAIKSVNAVGVEEQEPIIAGYHLVNNPAP